MIVRMSSTSTGALLFSRDLIDFIHGPVAIKVGSCSIARVPSVSQGYGCRISRSDGDVCVFLSESRSASVLRDLRDGGAFSAAFSRPATHRTVQLKASFVQIEPLQPGDQALIDQHGLRAAGELISLGYAPEFSQALMAPEVKDAICVCFRPLVAFDQTPGAGAGQPLGAGL
jgi:hypothetical protein